MVVLKSLETTFNRTSMESKLIIIFGYYAFLFNLLIEPVWNRNSNVKERDGSTTDAFNRTSMESKLRSGEQATDFRTAFNRTSMESKPKKYHTEYYSRTTFNRTSMESKLIISRTRKQPIQLLIEPVWNRNVYDRLSRPVRSNF